MENLLGFLVIIGGLIYKFYTEYAKEQKKAAARDPKKPIVNEQKPVVQTTKQAHKPIPTPNPIATREVSTTLKSQKPRILSSQPKSIEQNLPEEVMRLRKAKELERKKPYKALTLHDLAEEQDGKIDFDLRKAVIQATILERPYQY